MDRHGPSWTITLTTLVVAVLPGRRLVGSGWYRSGGRVRTSCLCFMGIKSFFSRDAVDAIQTRSPDSTQTVPEGVAR